MLEQEQDILTTKSILYNLVFFSSRRRHTGSDRDWSSDVCSSDFFCVHGRQQQGFHAHSTVAGPQSMACANGVKTDRKSVVEGKSVDSSCRCSINK